MAKRIEAAYESGAAEAGRDITAGRLRLHHAARGAWGRDLAKTLASRFDIELVVLSCFTTDESLSFVAGYNAAVETHIDGRWGHGSVASVLADVQRRRQEAYDTWASTRQAD